MYLHCHQCKYIGFLIVTLKSCIFLDYAYCMCVCVYVCVCLCVCVCVTLIYYSKWQLCIHVHVCKLSLYLTHTQIVNSYWQVTPNSVLWFSNSWLLNQFLMVVHTACWMSITCSVFTTDYLELLGIKQVSLSNHMYIYTF